MKDFVKYEKPLLEVVFFNEDDIVKTSPTTEGGGRFGSDWDIFG